MMAALSAASRDRLSGRLGRPLGLAAVLIVTLGLSWAVPGAALGILTTLLVNLLLAQSMNILTGLAGQVSLGHAGFVGIGAYASALLMRNAGLTFPLAVALSTLLTAATGFLLSLPAGKLRMVHMAVITLAFGLIAEEAAIDLTRLTGAPPLTDIPSAALGNLTMLGIPLDRLAYFQVVLVITSAVVFLVSGMTRSCVGRSLIAIRADEVAAATLGISLVARKRRAYALSGALAGLAGALYVHLTGTVSPGTLDLSQSVEVLVIVLLGGLGSMAGQFVSAALITFLPEILQAFMPYGYPQQLMLYGVIIAFAMLLAPRGLGALFPAPRFIDLRSLRLAGSRRAQAVPRLSGHATNAGLVAGNITLRFGGLTALEQVSLTLQPGRVAALIGPNGAGKTSLIHILTGIYRPTSGKARFFGRTITERAAFLVASYGLRRSFQVPRLVGHFTVRENLMLGAHGRLVRNALYTPFALSFALHDEADILCQINALLDLAGLTELADRTIDTLPHGARRLTEIARLLIANPRALILDEPSAGLSDSELVALVRLIQAIKQAGIILMLVEPHLDFVAPLVDDVVVMNAGRLIFNGDVAGMRTSADVVAAYHGATAVPMPEGASA